MGQREADWEFIPDAEVPRPFKYVPTAEEQRKKGMKWKVVGAGDGKGILVRRTESLLSQQFNARLATGTLVMATDDVTSSNRLHYERLSGDGPDYGWVSLTSKGTDLLVPV